MNIKSISLLSSLEVYTKNIISAINMPNTNINALYLPYQDDFINALLNSNKLNIYMEVSYDNLSLKIDFLSLIYWIFNRIEYKINELSAVLNNNYIHISGDNNIGPLELTGSLKVNSDITCTNLINANNLTAANLTTDNLTSINTVVANINAENLTCTTNPAMLTAYAAQWR